MGRVFLFCELLEGGISHPHCVALPNPGVNGMCRALLNEYYLTACRIARAKKLD